MERPPAAMPYGRARREVPILPDQHRRQRRGQRGLGAWPAAFVALAMLGGCVTHAPSIAVDGVSVRSRTEDAMLVDVAITFRNENTGEVVLREFEYSVAGSSSFSGRRRAALTLAPLSTETLLIPAVIATGAPAGETAQAEALRVSGTVGWRGSADLEKAFYDSGLYRPQASFSGTVVPGPGSAAGAAPPPPVSAAAPTPPGADSQQVGTPEAGSPPTGSDRRPR